MSGEVPVGGQAQRFAGPDAELGHVQRTLDHVVVDPAFGQRELLVGAGVVEGEVLAADVVDGHRLMVALDASGLAGRKLVHPAGPHAHRRSRGCGGVPRQDSHAASRKPLGGAATLADPVLPAPTTSSATLVMKQGSSEKKLK